MILDGKKVSKLIREKVAKEVAKINDKLKLLVILVGSNDASKLYIRYKEKACKEVGIDTETLRLSEDTSEEELLEIIKKANNDITTHAILVQLPLPKHINSQRIIKAIDPNKDVDGLTMVNQAKLFNNVKGIIPATPKGVISILNHHNINLEGLDALVVGRSNLVGKPLSMLLVNENATVTIAHSKTKDLTKIAKSSDLIVAAAGSVNLITKEMVKKDVIIVDVGTNRIDGKVVGDVAFDEVKDIASFITPVPGGIGPMTIASLLENVLECYKLIKESI